MHIGENYLDRVHLLGYPKTPTDASIKISELRSSDTGVYRCEVQHDIEDSHDDVHVQVKGTQLTVGADGNGYNRSDQPVGL